MSDRRHFSATIGLKTIGLKIKLSKPFSKSKESPYHIQKDYVVSP